MKIKYNNDEINLHSTCKIDSYYTSDIPEKLLDLLANEKPYLRNDSYTVFSDMVFIDLFFNDDEGNKFKVHVSYNFDEDYPIENYSEFLMDENNFQIEQY